MSAIVWTHRCRIYRVYLRKTHDLNLIATDQDIYGEDKSCRVESGTTDILSAPAGGEFGLLEHPADIWFPRGLDVREGSFVQVHKPRVIDGDRENVTGTMTVGSLTDAVELTLDTTVGFESGDEIVISDGSNRQAARIKTVTAAALTLYGEHALTYDFAADSTVVADYWYTIHSMLTPHGVGPVVKAAATRKFWTNV